MLPTKLLQTFRLVRPENLLQFLPVVSSINTQRNIFSFATLQSKVFHDNENNHAHQVLVNTIKSFPIFQPITVNSSSSLKQSLPQSVIDPLDYIGNNVNNLVEDFKSLMLYCHQNEECVSNDKFDKFVQLFCTECHKFTDEQLIDCLSYLRIHPPTVSTRTKNYCEIWNELDKVCLNRVERWSMKELLHISDAWYQLGVARISKFVLIALRKIGRKVPKMSRDEMIHSMFFCNIVRRPVIEMFDYEVNFFKLIDGMSIDEIGVMSMGFFKTQTPIRNPELLNKIIQRTMESAGTIKDITLVAILKILRYSSKLPQADLLTELLDTLVPQIERISLLSCLHVALLGSDIQTCHEEVVELILKRFLREMDSTRLKDMERICHVISLFNFKSPNGLEKELCEKIMDRVKGNVEECVRYPRCFSNLVHFLTLCGFHDEELISSVLDVKFIKHAYDTNIRLGREIFCLDAFVKINLKDTYKGNQLPDKYRKTMGRLMTHYIPERNPKFKLSTTDRILLEIKEATDSLMRTSTFKHVLPHFERPDVVLCFDTMKKKAIPISPECPENYQGAILTRQDILGDLANDANIVTVAIAVGGWNNAVRDKNRPTGSFQMKIKQLELLGHKPCLIYWHEWRLLENHKDRKDYMKRKLSAVCC
ncbi:uncharacterized protein LOC129910997 [Episyrphus balteatus]|uniref:uncharacterized protein LOC129910997 n=1 Tax=Episyrphus balteatus TaxID=286459 RepID=UPI002484EF0F|nr:uncharacterized protein LOC129910997 [Episyrphus balteatus]